MILLTCIRVSHDAHRSGVDQRDVADQVLWPSPVFGSSTGSVVQAAKSTRRRRRLKLLRPKVWRFSIFNFPTCSAVCPLLHVVVSTAFTAAPSCCSPAAKVAMAATPLCRASSSQPSRAVTGALHCALVLVLQLRRKSVSRRTSPTAISVVRHRPSRRPYAGMGQRVDWRSAKTLAAGLGRPK